MSLDTEERTCRRGGPRPVGIGASEVTVQLSLILILGAAAAGLVRSEQLKPAPGLIAALFGFLLHDTSLAPTVRHVVATLVAAITELAS